jgi:chemosensory pili system protein ChpA (sensor histidine kinase/response regulator)
VATDSITEFDPGPLTWVQRETNEALTRGLESLAAFREADKNLTALKEARLHVHQAFGAIRMAGLEAVAEFTDEIERHLDRLEQLRPSEVDAVGVVIERACRKLSIFLRDLASGTPLVTLKLYPEYKAMQKLRGIDAAPPSNLFYPDLSRRAPRVVSGETVPRAKLPSYLAKKRRLYQGGLLSLLRGDAHGAAVMHDAVSDIERVTAEDNLRSFWWTVRAFLEALTERGLSNGPDVKCLAARVDLQIRRVVEGSPGVADRLRREVLYYVARSAPVSPTVQAVQCAFGLGTLLPSEQAINEDVVAIEPIVLEARERLASIRDTWLNFASGRAENLEKLKQTLTDVHNKATELANSALIKVTAALVGQLDRMPSGAIPEPLAMEFTTALLLAADAFDNYANLPANLEEQVNAMLQRLDGVHAGRTMPGDATMLGDLGKRARERILLTQVGHEIEANLRSMEEVLDAFFRDSSKRTELASLVKESSQIHGALRILGFDRADQLLTLCDQKIQAYTNPETVVVSAELELLAESLCGLGFYFEAVEQQRPNCDRLIAPLLARWLGDAPLESEEKSVSVESAVAALRIELPGLLEVAHRGVNDPAALDELRRKLAMLEDDARLIGDEELVAQVQVAIAELGHGGDALAAAVHTIAETCAPAPAISEETQRLLHIDATELDAGLLDVYFSEAAQVLAMIAASHGALVSNAGDREALHAARRGFHTLKESTRMVGLGELSVLASDVEEIHNRLIEEGRPVTHAVIAMIDTAQTTFGAWVDTLRRTPRLAPDPGALRTALRGVESELLEARSATAIVATDAMAVVGNDLQRQSQPLESGADGREAPVKRAPIKPVRHIAIVQSVPDDVLVGIHDEVDEQLVLNFLEEAAQLFPAAGDQLRAWRQAPQDPAAAEALRHTLHALKCGARMAGAMRLGQLAHSTESQLLAIKHRVAASPELFDALDADLDVIAYMLDKLLLGEANVALPRLVPNTTELTGRPEATHPAPKVLVDEHPAVVSSTLPVVSAGTGELVPRTMAEPMSQVLVTEGISQATLHAREDAIFEASKSSGEGIASHGGAKRDIGVIKANLLQLANNVSWLRDRVLEIEIQTDVQMHSRMTELRERHGECNSGEHDGLSRVRELAHALNDAINRLAAVQQSLLRDFNDTDESLLAQRHAVNEN